MHWALAVWLGCMQCSPSFQNAAPNVCGGLLCLFFSNKNSILGLLTSRGVGLCGMALLQNLSPHVIPLVYPRGRLLAH